MVGFVVMAPTGGASSSPATAAAVRRTTPSTVAPGSASSVLLIATTLTPRSATGAACRPPACRAATWTWRAAPVHSGSVKACGSTPSPSVATSSEAEYQSPHELPSRLVRTCTSTSPDSAGGRQMTPTRLKRRPGSMVTASSAVTSAGAAAARPTAPAATRGAVTGSAADRAIVRVRTPDVRTRTIALSAALPVTAPRVAAGAVGRAAAAPAEVTAEDAVTIDPGLRFNLVGVICRPPAESGDVLVQVRTSLDGSSWGDWYSASLEVATEGDGVEPQAFTEPLWTGAARYVQVCLLY